MPTKLPETDIDPAIQAHIMRTLVSRAQGGRGSFVIVYFNETGAMVNRFYTKNMTARKFRDVAAYSENIAEKKGWRKPEEV